MGSILFRMISTQAFEYGITPPAVLYHGTGEKYASLIDAQGLTPKSRLYIHLSSDIETARKVGQRYGKPLVYFVKSGDMSNAGYWLYVTVQPPPKTVK